MNNNMQVIIVPALVRLSYMFANICIPVRSWPGPSPSFLTGCRPDLTRDFQVLERKTLLDSTFDQITLRLLELRPGIMIAAQLMTEKQAHHIRLPVPGWLFRTCDNVLRDKFQVGALVGIVLVVDIRAIEHAVFIQYAGPWAIKTARCMPDWALRVPDVTGGNVAYDIHEVPLAATSQWHNVQ